MTNRSGLSRRAVAKWLASQPSAKRQQSLRVAAAWLVQEGRTKEAGYLVRDVAEVEAENGHVWARVTTAHTMNTSTKSRVAAWLRAHTGAKTIELDLVVDPGLIGGIKLETATTEFDATLQTQLARLLRGRL